MAVRVADLQAGDVLLFRCPDVTWSWGHVEATPQLRAVKDEGYVRMAVAFHELITELDGSPYTHAAIVLEPDGRDPVLGNSDENDLRRARLDELRWEYGHAPFSVRRPDLTDDQIAHVVAVAQELTPTNVKPAYPYRDMLPAGSLLSIRHRPLQLPLLDERSNRCVNLALRLAADTYMLERVELHLATVNKRRWVPPPPGSRAPVGAVGFMCAAFVATVFERAGHPFRPAVRPSVGEANPATGKACHDKVELPPGCIDRLVGPLHHIAYGTTHTQDTVRHELDRAVERDQLPAWRPPSSSFLPADHQAWLARLVRRLPPGTVPTPVTTIQQLVAIGAAAEDLPVVAPFATAYDLDHSDMLDTIGDCPWEPIR